MARPYTRRSPASGGELSRASTRSNRNGPRRIAGGFPGHFSEEIHDECCDMDEDCWCGYTERARPRSLPKPGVTGGFWLGLAVALVMTGAFALTMVVLIGALL